MTAAPILETARLRLTPLHQIEPSRLVDFVTSNRAHLAPWEPTRLPEYFTEKYWALQVRNARPETPVLAAVRFVLSLKSPEVIGTVNISQITRGPFQAAYLGYGIGAAHGGKGLMTEALREVIRFAFDDLKLHRLMANHLPENVRSEALLARLGFVREGFANRYLFIDGAWRDHVLTSLTNPKEWDPT